MGLLSVLTLGIFFSGYSYLGFQGQMRNIGLGKTLLALMLPLPLAVPLIFFSKFKSPQHEEMARLFHGNLFKNLLLAPFRLFASAVGAFVSKFSHEEDLSLRYAYGELYREAKANVAEKEVQEKNKFAEAEERGHARGLEESTSGQEQKRMQEEILVLRAEISSQNDDIFEGYEKMDGFCKYKLDGLVLPDGRKVVRAPFERMGTVQEQMNSCGHSEVIVVSSYQFELFRSESREGYCREGGLIGVDRNMPREFYMVYDAFERKVDNAAEHYGLSESYGRYESVLNKVSRVNGQAVRFAKDCGVSMVFDVDQLSYKEGMYLKRFGDDLELYSGSRKLGSISFKPENGEGKEYVVEIGGLREVLSDGMHSDLEFSFRYALGSLYSGTEMLSEMEKMSGPELAEVWCDTVNEPSNNRVLMNLVSTEGEEVVQAEYRNAQEREAREQKARETEKLDVKVEKTRTVKVDEGVKVSVGRRL